MCTLLTGAILILMHLIALVFCENQLNARNYLLLQNHLNNITSSLQTSHTISQSWLAQTETSGGIIISIKDNGHSMLFPGSFETNSDRSTLIEQAYTLAQEKYAFDPYLIPVSKLNISSVTFELTTKKGEHFLTGICIIPSANGAYSLTVLKDMKNENIQILKLRLLFMTLIGLGVFLLALFSFWFTKRTIAPIEENNRRQTEFVAAASHELRSPLAVIQASASNLTYEDLPSHTHFTSLIIKECNRMGRLINDLLLLANADAKTWSIQFTPIELDTLLINLYELFMPISKLHDISLTLLLPASPIPPISADSERLEQVITILLDNAFAYTPKGGKIILSLTYEAHHFQIKVIDNGIGIPPEHKDRIFDRFYRIDKTRRSKEHFGLGLSIAYEIVQLHHGQLLLKDTPEGGCTFFVDLFQVK
jgi:signal transduction histidine kinase